MEPRSQRSRPPEQGRLVDAYQHVLVDLDGVVYRGADAVPGAAQALAEVRAAGRAVSFVTNNAGRAPEQVAAHLVELGIEAEPADVVTAAQAAAARLTEHLPAGAPVFLAGGEGLRLALVEAGLRPVTALAEQPRAVASGFGPDLPWQRIVDAGILLRDAVPWVASNADLSFPTGHGLGPGHGALVGMLERFSNRPAEVVGKPHPGLFREALRRNGAGPALMVGDRLDTDIAGAAAAGLDSLLVLTGVTTRDDLAQWPGALPTHVGRDLRALLEPLRAGSGDAPRAEPPADTADGSVTP